MTSPDEFSYEEWVTLRAVFCAILLDMAIADHELDDSEAKAWRGEVNALTASALPLVRALLTLEKGTCMEEEVTDKAAQTAIETLLTEAGEILKAKATQAERDNYVRSVRSLAIAVAEGAKGGDEDENKVLAHLNDELWKW